MKLAEMEQESLKRMNVAWQPEAEQNLIPYSSLWVYFLWANAGSGNN